MKAKLAIRFINRLEPKDKPYEVSDTELSGFLVRVQPSGIKTYYAAYKVRGKRRNRVRLGRTNLVSVAEAKKQARVVLGDVAKGLDPSSTEHLISTHTLGGFIDGVYGPWVVTDQKTGKQTVKRLKTAFHGLLELKLRDIGPWQLDKWRIERLETAYPFETPY